MFREILFLSWRGSRWGLLPFLLAAFALPIMAVQGLSPDPSGPASSTVRTTEILYLVQFWAPLFPALAFALGATLALLVWNWDHRGEHVYALTLPLPRPRYVLMKMGAGGLILLLPAVLLWLGCVLGTGFTRIPEGLHAYPHALSFRFLLAALVAYALFFALAAGTMRTTLYLLAGWLALLFLGQVVPPFLGEVFHFQPLYEFSLVEWLLTAVLDWPGPFEVYTGNWMLIDV